MTRATPTRRLVVLCSVVVMAICGTFGCRRDKPSSQRNMVVSRKINPSKMSIIPAYNRYFAMWRIAHSNLKTTIQKEWNVSEIEHTFDQAVENLRLMNKFLKDEKKKLEIDTFTAEYEYLRRTVNPGQPGRRSMARLDRLEVKIKKRLSPKDRPK
jgi:hypothetical protein